MGEKLTDVEQWKAGVLRRLAEPRVAAGTWTVETAAASAAELFAALLPDGVATDGHHILDLGGGRGHVWMRVTGSEAFVLDWEVFDRDAIERAAIDLGASLLRINVFSSDGIARALVDAQGFNVTNYQMRKRLDLAATVPGSDVDLRSMTADEFAVFRETEERSYAEDLVRARQERSLEEALARSVAENDESFPDGVKSVGPILRTAFVDDAAVGTLWMEIDGSSAFVYDLYVRPDVRRNGYGRAIMEGAEAEARKRGTDVLGLSVFGFNDAAIALYRSLGFEVTEQMLWKALTSGEPAA
jgi:ribosomal protein S18 acetylase RimI-like enzyme